MVMLGFWTLLERCLQLKLVIKKLQRDCSVTSWGFHSLHGLPFQLSKEPAREDCTCEGHRGLHKPAGASERCQGARVALGWWIC